MPRVAMGTAAPQAAHTHRNGSADSLTAGTAKLGHFPHQRWAVQSPGNVGGFRVGIISAEEVQAQTASPSHGVPGTQQCPINPSGPQRWTTLAKTSSSLSMHHAVMGICVQTSLPEPQCEPLKQGVGSPGLLSVCTCLGRSLPGIRKVEERLLSRVPIRPTHLLGPPHAQPEAPSFCWTPAWP